MCIGCLSLLVGGFYEYGAIAAVLWPFPTSSYDQEHEAAIFAAVILGLDVLLAPFLLLGAWLLLKSNPKGLRIHWLYAVLKLVTTVLGGFAIYGLFAASDSEIVVMAPIVFIPCLLALIYPIALLIVLSKESVQTPTD